MHHVSIIVLIYLFRNPFLSTDLGFQPIVLSWMGSSCGVVTHLREKHCRRGPDSSAPPLRRVGLHTPIWDLVSSNQLWCVIFQWRAANRGVSDRC